MTQLDVKGLHHFTAIAGDPTENAKFYVNTLGLRLVKKTVNHDAPQMYHLFYGDGEGTPGSGITFFPGMTDEEGKMGAGMITELGLRIPGDSLDYWEERLKKENIEYEIEQWRGKETLAFTDPDGLPLRLVPDESGSYKTWSQSNVPEKHQIQGMYHVTLSIHESDEISPVIEEMGMKEAEEDDGYFRMEDGTGVEVKRTEEQGKSGKGTVHHIAFKAGENEEEIENWTDKLQRLGMRPSPPISRKYFTSTYARTPVGILFEFSSMGPGYTADETVEELGSSLVLPERYESAREQIEASLPEFREEELDR